MGKYEIYVVASKYVKVTRPSDRYRIIYCGVFNFCTNWKQEVCGYRHEGL